MTRATQDLLLTISVTSVALWGGAIVAVALVRRRPHLALGAAAVIAGANVTTQVLKRALLPRPDLLDGAGGATPSFPSGHTTVAMSLALAAVMVAPRAWRGLVAALGVAYAVAIGVGTVTTGWHRPSDVVGAYLVVGVWSAGVSAWLVSRRGRWAPRPGRPALRRATREVAVLAGVLLVTLAVALVAALRLADRLGRVELVEPGRAYALAAVTMVAVAVSVGGALVVALRGITIDPPERRRRA